VVYSFCATPNNLGVPVSSWGTLEYNRVGLTIYILCTLKPPSWLK
jgi:hypothetical protein